MWIFFLPKVSNIGSISLCPSKTSNNFLLLPIFMHTYPEGVISFRRNLILPLLSLNRHDYSPILHFDNGLVLFSGETCPVCEYPLRVRDLIFCVNIDISYVNMHAKNYHLVSFDFARILDFLDLKKTFNHNLWPR